MDKEKSLNTFSIVAFILSFILFPVGLILSIIGMVRCNKYKKETGRKPSYYIFNIIGLIVSVLVSIIIAFVFFLIIFVFGVLSYNKKYVIGTYTCYYPYSYKPAVTAKFNNNNFTWSKYNDELSNSISGKYRLKSVQIKNDIHAYKIQLTPNTYKTSARIGTKSNYDIIIKKQNNKTTITFDNGTTYNCTKGSSNEF